MSKTDFEKMTDEQLAGAALTNPESFGVLAARYFIQLKKFIFYNYIREDSAAEDIAQEALVRAYLGRRSFDLGRKWKTWIYAIAANCAISWLRRPVHTSIDAPHIQNLESNKLDADLEKYFESERLYKALKNLELRQQKILQLVYLQEMDLKQAAAAMGLNRSVAKSLLHRAKLNLALGLGTG